MRGRGLGAGAGGRRGRPGVLDRQRLPAGRGAASRRSAHRLACRECTDPAPPPSPAPPRWANSDILLVSDGELRQPGPDIMRKLAGAKDKLG